ADRTVREHERRARLRASLLRGLGGVLVDLPEPELVPLRVLADGEPAHLRNGHGLAGLAAELLYASDALADVVDVEVRPDPALAGLHVGDGDAPLVVDASREVLTRSGVRLTELPPEQPAPELASLRGVVGRDLEMDRLTSHGHPPSGPGQPE